MKAKPKPQTEKPIVQTVKLSPAVYVRLKTFGAKTRRTNQDILQTALIEYLKSKGQ